MYNIETTIERDKKKRQQRSPEEQVKHFLSRQMVTADWGQEAGSSGVEVLSATVVDALKAANYNESQWVQELKEMAAEGVLGSFVQACMQPPTSPQQHERLYDDDDDDYSDACFDE